ncbi:MAG TPA: hypothetical protein PKH92_04615 [Anaerolineaceae bacterium]|jgi:hypothetical protein|nr:hypothetical protein [Anaerolineaceae bacterium]HOD04309.1 hypothetical protein [Anaerolineaceae bacterium]HQF61603.1 hypothetical protein [Anaerolineaceae bacterium]HQH84098.1 hypothetical protein [Anaerolineaceae bacterium]HQN42822.1 hypothetical protein [Anaerolineaceae bacterium]
MTQAEAQSIESILQSIEQRRADALADQVAVVVLQLEPPQNQIRLVQVDVRTLSDLLSWIEALNQPDVETPAG